jgi:putative transposase
LCIKYTEEVEYLQIYSNNTASIDLGEIHSITSIDSSGNAIIITGRLMRSIKQLRNKEQAKIYKRLSKCTKGSRQYKKYMVALTDLSVKTNRKINDCIHKISKLYLDFCILNNISTIYYGDLDSATRSTRQKKKGKGLVRQKLSQWNFGYLMARIENRLTKHGIIAIKVKEYYTSSKCPSCTKLNKPKNREYVCSCGYKQHRDIVGAINILNDNGGYTLKYYKNKKYLQIV